MRKSIRLSSLLVAMALQCGLLSARSVSADSATCSQQEIEKSSREVSSVRQKLLALPVGDGLNTEVSATAKAAIFSMKEALNRFAVAYMLCMPFAIPPDAAKVQSDLMRASGHAFPLDPKRVYKPDELPADAGNYGFEVTFDVRVTKDARHLVSIKADFTIECGDDAVLMVFAPDGDSWKEVLRWQSSPYDTVAGAFWAFDYSISPPDASSAWFVAAKSVMPWCSSTWSSIRYAVLRPESDPSTPSMLMAGEKSIWWGGDDAGTVTTTRDTADIRFHAASLDAGVHNRVYIFHYLVSGYRVVRTQPVAVSPRDFVDEWIRTPWPEAARWSTASSGAILKASHSAVQRRSERELFSFDSATRCKGARDRYEIGISYDDRRRYYFRVSGSDEFAVVSVSTTSDPACKGLDVLATMETK